MFSKIVCALFVGAIGVQALANNYVESEMLDSQLVDGAVEMMEQRLGRNLSDDEVEKLVEEMLSSEAAQIASDEMILDAQILPTAGVSIVVNRASQRMTVSWPGGQDTFPVSTGGGRKCPKNGRACYNAGTPARSGITGQTYTGNSKFSNLFRVPLPWATHLWGGFYIHAAPAGTEGLLGTRASGGCIRTPYAKAKMIVELIRRHGPATYTIN